MKKFATIGMAVAGVMAVTGISTAGLLEYLQVARNRIATTIRDSVPLSVEIDRMEVLLEKLDGQVGQQEYAVSKSKVALQDAEAEFQRAQVGCKALVRDMRQLRGLSYTEATGNCGTIKVGGQSVSPTDVRRALTYKLSSWKGATAAAEAREQALLQQRAAYSALERQFNDWQGQRQLLAQRVETLKTRHQTQALASETDTSTFNNADLARATELADQIERELRIVEAQQALGSGMAESVLNNQLSDADTSDVEQEVDRLLGQQTVSR